MTELIRDGVYWVISTLAGSGDPIPLNLPRNVLKRIAEHIKDQETLRNFALTCRMCAEIVRELHQPIVEIIINTRMEDYLGSSSEEETVETEPLLPKPKKKRGCCWCCWKKKTEPIGDGWTSIN